MADQWIQVKVHPSTGKDVLVSIGPGRVEVWIKAKPLDGRANEAISRLLAEQLHIPRTYVRLVKGRASRYKVFRILS